MTDSERLDRIIVLLERLVVAAEEPPDVQGAIMAAAAAVNEPRRVLERVAAARDASRVLDEMDREGHAA